MPIYNNPAIGQAFENLAGMFAPPSGQDAAAWAAANAKNAEAQRRAELYAGAAGDPDRQAVIADLYDPTQSYHAVGLNNAATLRGQDVAAQTSIANNAADNARARYGIDVGSGDARYGVDVGARTSIANNAADNARALQDRTLQEQGSLERLFAAPITVARGARTFLPGQTAAATGLSPVLDGPAAPLNESETIATVLQGMRPEDQQRIIEQKYAMSGDQVKGDILRTLAGSGNLSQDQINRAAGISDPDVEKVVGEDGKPVFATRTDAIGKQAFVNEGAQAAPQLRNYQTSDGRNGNAVYDNGRGTWVDTTTKVPLPEGSTLYTGELSGGGAETGFGPQKPNLVAATNLEASLDSAQQLSGNLRGILAQNANVAGIPGRVKGIAQSLASSANQVLGAYGPELPISADTLEQIKAAAARATPPGSPNYDANIVRLQSGLYDLAYMRAQINNPTGEVSRQAFDRAMESLGQSVLSSQEDLSTALDAFEKDTIAIGRTKVQSLRGQREGSDTVGRSQVTRDPAADTVAPASGAPKRMRWNPATESFE